MLRFFEQLNWDNSLKGIGIFEPIEVLPLQAADFICHIIKEHGAERKKSHRKIDWRKAFVSATNNFSFRSALVGRLPTIFFEELSS